MILPAAMRAAAPMLAIVALCGVGCAGRPPAATPPAAGGEPGSVEAAGAPEPALGGPGEPLPAGPDAAPEGPVQRGRATYYADRFTGRRTASGERYDPRALTAAHRTLPFGAVVDVIRADGRRVRVRINDRGPFGKGRIIDLSRRAAESIGMIRDGIVDVSVRVVSMPPRQKKKKR